VRTLRLPGRSDVKAVLAGSIHRGRLRAWAVTGGNDLRGGRSPNESTQTVRETIHSECPDILGIYAGEIEYVD
jgi:hypothetical protein